MPKPRVLVTVDEIGHFVGLTEYIADQSFQSSWSHPDVPLLIFADSGIGAAPVTFHGGPIGSGLPIEALFWGDWWLSPEGVDRQSMIAQRLQAIIASPYFSELAQYGIQPPHWRGSKVVTRPSAPTAFNSNSDMNAVPDLIDALIDDDVFPDPDDEQIAQLVFMPKGFTQTVGARVHILQTTITHSLSTKITTGSDGYDGLMIFPARAAKTLPAPQRMNWSNYFPTLKPTPGMPIRSRRER